MTWKKNASEIGTLIFKKEIGKVNNLKQEDIYTRTGLQKGT